MKDDFVYISILEMARIENVQTHHITLAEFNHPKLTAIYNIGREAKESPSSSLEIFCVL